MSTQTKSAVIAGEVLAVLFWVAVISLLIWAGLGGFHHPVPFWPTAALVGAFLALVRLAFPRRSA